MFAVQRVARQLHRPPVERASHVPGRRRQEGVRRRAVEHGVAVAPAGSRAAGVEVGGNHGGPAHHDGWAEALVDGALQLGGIGVGPGVEAHDLAPGVHSSVGAAGAGQLDRVAQGALENGDECARYRPLPGLSRESPVAGAEVGHSQGQPDGWSFDDSGRAGRGHVVAEEG